MRKNTYTILVLLILTLVTAITSMNFELTSWLAPLVLILSSLKFLLVTFQFMELKKAHTLWKGLIITFLMVFVGIILIIL